MTAAGTPAASGLSWGVLGRFTAYVRGSGGDVVASDGAVLEEGGMASWPLAGSAVDATGGGEGEGEGVLNFRGCVRFVAHFGALDLPIRDPELEIDGDLATLRIPDPAGSAPTVLARMVWSLAERRLGFEAWIGDPVELAASAGHLFGGVYPQGTRLDPLIVVRQSMPNR